MQNCIGVYIVLWILSLYVTYLHSKLNWLENELKKVSKKDAD